MREERKYRWASSFRSWKEAIAVGISNCLNSDDRIFGAHRSHSHLLSLNPDTHSLFAEVLGKETDFQEEWEDNASHR